MKKILLSGLIAMTAIHVSAQKKIEFVEYDLPNGIHIILHEEHATPIVAVSVLYHVGSKNEKVGRTGFAHFFEHLLFEGTQNIKRGEFDDLIEGNGGANNANTSFDRTFYYETLPSNQLELGIWIESERMLHAKVENIGIETQRSVVKEEKRQRIDNQPYATAIEQLFKRIFTDHPYRWQPIGSMEDLDAAQEEDYVSFYRTYYVPSNATVSIAGDINIAQAKIWVDKYFGSIPSGQAVNLFRDFENLPETTFIGKYGIPKSEFDASNFMVGKTERAKKLLATYKAKPTEVLRPEKPKQMLTTVERADIYDNIQLPGIFIGYSFPEEKNADMYALQMMNSVLSGSESSRLNKSLIEKDQVAVYAFSAAYGLEDAGVGLFGAIGADKVPLEEIEKALDKEIDLIKTELISQEEFEKVRNQYENDFVTSNSSVVGIAENLANNHVYYGSANYVNTELSKYMAVTREDIQRVAKKYLTQDARVILHYLPKKEN